MKTLGIYIHIPFCSSKCGYCSFYSAPPKGDVMGRYIRAVERALSLAPYSEGKVDSIYFGGGTPSLAGESLIPLLGTIRERFSVSEDCEVTVEANPGTVTPKLLEALRQGGVNRLSFGVQTLNPQCLEYMGRRHSPEQALQAVKEARGAGFDNISVDLMLGLPHQTMRDVEEFAGAFGGLGVEHISAYILKIEEGTPFFEQDTGRLCPDDDAVAQMYLDTVKALERHGYMQYEISNFARNDKQSRHNTRYWLCEEYLGIGAAAHGYFGGVRGCFPSDTEAFAGAANPWDCYIHDGTGGDFTERCMLGLRLSEGIDLVELAAEYQSESTEVLQSRAKVFIERGYMWQNSSRLGFTTEGFLVSNSLLTELLY